MSQTITGVTTDILSTQYFNDVVYSFLSIAAQDSEIDVLPQTSSVQIDYVVKSYKVGVSIVVWRKPITSRIMFKLWDEAQNLGLEKVILVTEQISDHAKDVIRRRHLGIIHVYPEQLTDIFDVIGKKIPLI